MQIGFAERLAYVRWLLDRGRVHTLTDGQYALWLGVGPKWLGKWKLKKESPAGRAEAKAIDTALRGIGGTADWLYDGKGSPPEPSYWPKWKADLHRLPPVAEALGADPEAPNVADEKKKRRTKGRS